MDCHHFRKFFWLKWLNQIFSEPTTPIWLDLSKPPYADDWLPGTARSSEKYAASLSLPRGCWWGSLCILGPVPMARHGTCGKVCNFQMLSVFLRDLNHGKVPRCPEVDEPLEQVELILAHDSHEIYAGDFGFIAFDCLGAVPLLVVMESEVPELWAC